MKRALAVALVVVNALLALVISACGGGGTDEEPTVPTPRTDCQDKPEACK